MSDPAVVECVAYGVSKIQAQKEEQNVDYARIVPSQPIKSSTAVYANSGRDERVYEELKWHVGQAFAEEDQIWY